MKLLAPQNAPTVATLPSPSAALAGASFRLAADGETYSCTGTEWRCVGAGATSTKVAVHHVSHSCVVGTCIALSTQEYPETFGGASRFYGIIDRVIDANNYVVVTRGVVNGLSGLTAGKDYFCCTSGTLLSADPSGLSLYQKYALETGEYKIIFHAVTSTSGYIIPSGSRPSNDSFDPSSLAWLSGSEQSYQTVLVQNGNEFMGIGYEGATSSANIDDLWISLSYGESYAAMYPASKIADRCQFNYLTKLEPPPLIGATGSKVYLTSSPGVLSLTPDGDLPIVVGLISFNTVQYIPPYIDRNTTTLSVFKDGTKVSDSSMGINFSGMTVTKDSNGLATVTAPAGSSVQNNFVQTTAPTVEAGTSYTWFQTGLGSDGNGITLWVEDGK